MTWVRTWTRFDWLWIGWIVQFLVIEIMALRDRRSGGTFSESWWWLIGIGSRKNRYAWVTRGMLFGFSSWLVAHLWSGKV